MTLNQKYSKLNRNANNQSNISQQNKSINYNNDSLGDKDSEMSGVSSANFFNNKANYSANRPSDESIKNIEDNSLQD